MAADDRRAGRRPLLDVTHTAGRRRDLATSRRIARFKSGRYTITRPLQLGALVAGARPVQLDRLLAWGDLVGDAFAVRDDLLGVWGDPASPASPRRRPARRQAHRAAHLGPGDAPGARPSAARRLRRRPARRRRRAALQAAMESAGVRERAEDEVARLAEQAHRDLEALHPDPAAEDALRDLVESIAWRSS